MNDARSCTAGYTTYEAAISMNRPICRQATTSTRRIPSQRNNKLETEVRAQTNLRRELRGYFLVGAAGNQTTTDKPPALKNSVGSSKQVGCCPCFRNVSPCP